MRPKLSLFITVSVLVFTGALSSCFQVKTHHTIDPITINMNVAVKVDRELDKMFSDLDAQSSTMVTP